MSFVSSGLWVRLCSIYIPHYRVACPLIGWFGGLRKPLIRVGLQRSGIWLKKWIRFYVFFFQELSSLYHEYTPIFARLLNSYPYWPQQPGLSRKTNLKWPESSMFTYPGTIHARLYLTGTCEFSAIKTFALIFEWINKEIRIPHV